MMHCTSQEDEEEEEEEEEEEQTEFSPNGSRRSIIPFGKKVHEVRWQRERVRTAAAKEMKRQQTARARAREKLLSGREQDAYALLNKKEQIPFLDYASKNLTRIPLELLLGPNILKLHLGFNLLESLDRRFFHLRSLKVLNLDQNELKVVHADFSLLENLEILSMKSNKIEQIDYRFCNLTNLTQLSLCNNDIQQLPHSFGKLSKLRALWLTGNSLRRLPHEEVVTLADYDPKTGKKYKILAPGVGSLTTLEELFLECNYIEEITKELANCISLRYINVRRNRIRELPQEFSKLSNLQHISASSNRISQFPECLFNLPALSTLDLSYNKIQALPESVMKATTLTDLDLSNNPLKQLPSILSLTNNLLFLRTENCRKTLDGKIIGPGWRRVYCHSDSKPRVKFVEFASEGKQLTLEAAEFRPKTSCASLYPDYFHCKAATDPDRRLEVRDYIEHKNNYDSVRVITPMLQELNLIDWREARARTSNAEAKLIKNMSSMKTMGFRGNFQRSRLSFPRFSSQSFSQVKSCRQERETFDLIGVDSDAQQGLNLSCISRHPQHPSPAHDLLPSNCEPTP